MCQKVEFYCLNYYYLLVIEEPNSLNDRFHVKSATCAGTAGCVLSCIKSDYWLHLIYCIMQMSFIKPIKGQPSSLPLHTFPDPAR